MKTWYLYLHVANNKSKMHNWYQWQNDKPEAWMKREVSPNIAALPNFMSHCHCTFSCLCPHTVSCTRTPMSVSTRVSIRLALTQIVSASVELTGCDWPCDVPCLVSQRSSLTQNNGRKPWHMGYHTDENWRSPPDSVCCDTKPQAMWWCSCSSLCCACTPLKWWEITCANFSGLGVNIILLLIHQVFFLVHLSVR